MGMSNIRRQLGTRLGLEDDSAATDAVAVPELPVEEATAAAVEPVAEATAEVEKTEEVVEELEEAKAGLEAIAISLESFAKDGGLNPQGAVMMQHAIQARLGRFGIAASEVMPSLESFGGTSQKATATNVSMEGLKSMIADMWKAIKDQLKKLWGKLKDWYLKVLDAAPRIKKHAEALKKKAEDTTGKAEGTTVDVSAAQQLHIAKSVKGFGPNVVKAVADVAKQALAVDLGKMADEVAGKLGEVKVADKTIDLGTAVASAKTEAGKLKIALATNAVSDAAKRYGAGIEAHGTAELAGGQMVVAVTPASGSASGKDVGSALGRCGLRVDIVGEKKVDVDSTGSFNILSPGDAAAVCDEVINICEEIISFKKQWDARDKSMATLEKDGDKLVAEIEKAKEMPADQRAPALAIIRGASGFVRGTKSDAGKLINYFLGVSRASLSVVEKSLAQYKKD